MKIEIRDLYIKELNYMIELHQQYGPSAHLDNLEALVNFIVWSITEGSRRPGAWEREMLYSMGLVANCDEHDCYRVCYGKPPEED